MALVAHSSELSLFDLLQVKGAAHATCRIAVQAPGAPGVLFLKRGVLVYATYGARTGEEAAYAILQEPHLDYHVTSDAIAPQPNMQVGHQALVLEAVRRIDECARRPVSASALPEAFPLEPAPTDQEARARSRVTWLVLTMTGLALAVATVALVAALCRSPGAALPATASAHGLAAEPGPGPAAAGALDASQLHEPGDRLPAALAAGRVPSPDPGYPLRPTVVCRLLVDASGAVAQARVYQHRDGLEAFEAAALASVRAYRFAPARRAGAPVPAWINWPVEFGEPAP